MYFNRDKQSKLQKAFLIILVAMISIGLLLPSFASLLYYI
jgi:hypothetical protein